MRKREGIVRGKLGRKIAGLIGFGIVFSVVFTAIMAPLIAPYDVEYAEPETALSAPTSEHWLGTDEDGADLLTQLVYGARVAVVVGFGTVFLSLFIGTIIGAMSGYYGGWIDELAMRVLEVFLSFPGILLAIFVIFLTQEPSIWSVIGALSITGWAGYARLVRGQMLSLKQAEFVDAARAMGASDSRVLFRHLLPNVVGPLTVQATFGIGGAVLAEASLSFLGLGPQDGKSWGALLDQGAILFLKTPTIALSAGGAVFVLVMGVNLLGDFVRDILDPQMS